MKISSLLAVTAASTGLLLASAEAQLRVQNHVIMGGDAAMRGFVESDFPRVHQLADGVYVAEDIAGPIDGNAAFTTNAMFIITEAGVVLFDAFKDVASTRTLIDAVGNLTHQPIRYLVIGADHPDHTAGNGALIEAFPDIVFIAHPNANLPDEQRARIGLYVADQHTLSIGGVDMRIMFLGRAHTGSDLVTYLPQHDVLWGSETWFNGIYPSAGGALTAFPIEWLEVSRRMDEIGADVILPNHGFIDNREVLRAQWREWLALMENLVHEGRLLHQRGVPLDRATYSINIGRFQYWYRAANNLHFMLLRLYGELEGEYEPYTVAERRPITMDGEAIER